MKLRTLSIYFAILVALIAWLYFWEIKHKGQEKAAKEEAEKIVRLDKDKIVEVDVQSKKNGKITIKKPDKEWILSVPVTTKADEAAVERLLASASGAKSERVISDKDVKWEEYGLDTPELTVDFATPEKRTRLSFGSLNPAKTSYYARAGDDPRLFLVADTLKNSMDKSPFDLREKTVLGIAPEDVDRIALKTKGVDIELEREGTDKWRMLKPEQIRVKTSMVNKTLIDLTNLQAKGIIDEPKKEGDPYGLSQPEDALTLSGKKLQQTLLVGRAATAEKGNSGSGSRYARIEGREPVYEVDASLLARLKADPQRLRDKSLVEVKPTEVEKIEIDLDGKKWIASKNSDKVWSLEAPQKEKLQAWEITSILWDLKGLEWKSRIVSSSGNAVPAELPNPRLSISLKLQDKKDPIVLRAGWAEASGQPPGEPQQVGSPQEAKKPASDNETTPASEKDASGLKSDSRTPDTIQVQVEPHEDRGALFTVDGRFLERLRTALDELGRKK